MQHRRSGLGQAVDQPRPGPGRGGAQLTRVHRARRRSRLGSARTGRPPPRRRGAPPGTGPAPRRCPRMSVACVAGEIRDDDDVGAEQVRAALGRPRQPGAATRGDRAREVRPRSPPPAARTGRAPGPWRPGGAPARRAACHCPADTGNPAHRQRAQASRRNAACLAPGSGCRCWNGWV